jgi:hypothetical protein
MEETPIFGEYAMTAKQAKDIREKLGLTQKALSILLGCSKGHIKKMESGERGITPEREEDLLWLEKNPPAPDPSASQRQRGRPSGHASQPKNRQEDKTKISWGMILGSIAAVGAIILVMVFRPAALPQREMPATQT